MTKFGTQFLDAMILRLTVQLSSFLLTHRLGSLFIQQEVLLGNLIGCSLLNACKLIPSFAHKRISLTFHDLRVKRIGLALQCLLLCSHQLACQSGIDTLLHHCHLGGTLINTVEVAGVQLTDVDTRIQNTWHVSAWIISAWVKVIFQVTHVTVPCSCT